MKYELIKLTKANEFYGSKVKYQIKALKNFNGITKGDLGGYVQNEHNLSQEGNCWLKDKARVYDNAQVLDNARIAGSAIICDNATVSGTALIYNTAKIYDNAKVFNASIIFNNAAIFGDAKVFGNAFIHSVAEVAGDASVTKRVFSTWYDTYNITGTDYHLRIGCQQHTYEKWWNFDNKVIAEMDKDALIWWKKWKPILMAIFENSSNKN